MALTAFLDACVLYPAPLRDLLIRLAVASMFRARWSGQVHDEWTRSLTRKRPDLADRLRRTREEMDRAVPDCLVRGYEHLIPSLRLPDSDDRHVLAAAIVGRADVLVTLNLRDFPSDVLAPHGIEARHPDDFISNVLESDEAASIAAVREHRAALKNPPRTPDEYLETIAGQGLTRTSAWLRPRTALI